ncbi:hypothetical protein [Burkholderia thailandensis]|uniref:hypothetical protein n=1 Tax=Burkholderia thailandensis TaxID=57975 RepID=UPI0022AC625E|nr:hypothetical protein [Burkholderia thailandensis]MCZ2900961.1 hypothetical protein [Burkholderia thailandensis]MDD1480959.1 hypothetical protein [Burkholderia thailandensis]MDD1489148.1 hypothetical protein [Burkholderia thailandensis]MDD1493898.1 hypothetical protein [Burkholderia thailandensis]
MRIILTDVRSALRAAKRLREILTSPQRPQVMPALRLGQCNELTAWVYGYASLHELQQPHFHLVPSASDEALVDSLEHKTRWEYQVGRLLSAYPRLCPDEAWSLLDAWKPSSIAFLQAGAASLDPTSFAYQYRVRDICNMHATGWLAMYNDLSVAAMQAAAQLALESGQPVGWVISDVYETASSVDEENMADDEDRYGHLDEYGEPLPPLGDRNNKFGDDDDWDDSRIA